GERQPPATVLGRNGCTEVPDAAQHGQVVVEVLVAVVGDAGSISELEQGRVVGQPPTGVRPVGDGFGSGGGGSGVGPLLSLGRRVVQGRAHVVLLGDRPGV